jgi:hypothetical protein
MTYDRKGDADPDARPITRIAEFVSAIRRDISRTVPARGHPTCGVVAVRFRTVSVRDGKAAQYADIVQLSEPPAFSDQRGRLVRAKHRVA